MEQVFHYGQEDGLSSWSEPETSITRPYDSRKEKQLGFKALTEKEVHELPPPDITLANKAITKLSQLKETQDEMPFFLALGFR